MVNKMTFFYANIEDMMQIISTHSYMYQDLYIQLNICCKLKTFASY